MSYTDAFEDGESSFLALGIAQTRKFDVLQYAQIGKDAGDLERIGYAGTNTLVGGHMGDVLAVEENSAAFDWHSSADKTDQRCLTGPIGADQRPYLAFSEREVHFFDCVQPAEGPAELAGFDQRAHGSHLTHLARIVPTIPFGK